MLARAPGVRTVPQIFIGERHVGGSDDLAALDRAGELDALLAT
jgi:glutaredoxin 3